MFIGPPLVRTYTMLKSASVKIVENRITTASTGCRSGTVTYQKRPTGPAPSDSAASYSSRGIATRPASIVLAKNGRPRHVFTSITANMAGYGSESQGMSPLTTCRALRVQFTTLESGSNIHHQPGAFSAVGRVKG